LVSAIRVASQMPQEQKGQEVLFASESIIQKIENVLGAEVADSIEIEKAA